MKSGDVVRVKVLSVDVPRNRIGLTLRLDEDAARRPREDRRPGGRGPGRGAGGTDGGAGHGGSGRRGGQRRGAPAGGSSEKSADVPAGDGGAPGGAADSGAGAPDADGGGGPDGGSVDGRGRRSGDRRDGAAELSARQHRSRTHGRQAEADSGRSWLLQQCKHELRLQSPQTRHEDADIGSHHAWTGKQAHVNQRSLLSGLSPDPDDQHQQRSRNCA